jgi:hypothetical protein
LSVTLRPSVRVEVEESSVTISTRFSATQPIFPRPPHALEPGGDLGQPALLPEVELGRMQVVPGERVS